MFPSPRLSSSPIISGRPRREPECLSRTVRGSDFTIFAIHSATGWLTKRKSNRKLFRESCVTPRFRRRSICTRRKTAMKRSQRKGNISPRWEWLRSWCSEVREVWVESVEIFGTTPGNLLKITGGPGWTGTTDLALIRVARLGFTTTYKTAGTAKIRGSRTSHRMLWVGLWVGKRP